MRLRMSEFSASMRVYALTLLLAALAWRVHAEPAAWARGISVAAPRHARLDASTHYASHASRASHSSPAQTHYPVVAAAPDAPPTRRRTRANWSKRTQRTRLPNESTQMMLRASRSNRIYDVPQIECPPAADGMERFACPTPDRQGRYRCIDDHVLCDGFINCPNGEDEDRRECMFYKTTKAHLDVLADALLRWARGR